MQSQITLVVSAATLSDLCQLKLSVPHYLFQNRPSVKLWLFKLNPFYTWAPVRFLLSNPIHFIQLIVYVQVQGLNFYTIKQHLFRADMVLTCWDIFALYSNSVLKILFIALTSMSLISGLSMFFQTLTKSPTQIIKQDGEEVRVLWSAVKALRAVILQWISSVYGCLTHYKSLWKRWPVGSWVLWSSRSGFQNPIFSLTNCVALNKFIKISHQQMLIYNNTSFLSLGSTLNEAVAVNYGQVPGTCLWPISIPQLLPSPNLSASWIQGYHGLYPGSPLKVKNSVMY